MDGLHWEHVDTAFLQLAFAIKLNTFMIEHPFDRGIFDIDPTITSEGNCVCLPGNQFHTDDALLLASENNISIAFGAASITLWEAIREHGSISSKSLKPQANGDQSLAALSYMIRCCFAHGSAAPKWSIQDPKYRCTYYLGNKVIDLSSIQNDQVFDYKSIGGYETLWMLKGEARHRGLI